MKTITFRHIVLLVATFIIGAGCSKAVVHGPDYPVPEPVTDIGRAIVEKTDLIAALYSDTSYQLTEGVNVTTLNWLSYDGKPQKAFFFDIDLNEESVTLDQVTPFNKGIGYGPQALTDMIKEVDSEDFYVWGGTNSDFGSESQKGPQGIFHHEGIAIKTIFNSAPVRPRSFFYLTKDKKARTAGAEYYSETVESEEILEAFGGGPVLVTNGNAVNIPDAGELDSSTGLYQTHPRTAIGTSADGKKVWIMVIDGRRVSYSNGMDLHDLALAMMAVGCDNAINLDGGGSSTFAVRTENRFDGPARFKVMNWPNDNNGQERGLYQGLVIVTKK